VVLTNFSAIGPEGSSQYKWADGVRTTLPDGMNAFPCGVPRGTTKLVAIDPTPELTAVSHPRLQRIT